MSVSSVSDGIRLLVVERLMDSFQRAIVLSAPVLLPDRRPRCEVVRQGSPGAAVLGLIKDRVPDLAQWIGRGVPLRLFFAPGITESTRSRCASDKSVG